MQRSTKWVHNGSRCCWFVFSEWADDWMAGKPGCTFGWFGDFLWKIQRSSGQLWENGVAAVWKSITNTKKKNEEEKRRVYKCAVDWGNKMKTKCFIFLAAWILRRAPRWRISETVREDGRPRDWKGSGKGKSTRASKMSAPFGEKKDAPLVSLKLERAK